MTQVTRFGWIVPVVALAALAMLSAFAVALAPAANPPCCFTNSGYEGVCTVIPREGETCDSILEYLNNPMSAGKSYCRGTSIRGGWVQVECKKAGSAPAR